MPPIDLTGTRYGRLVAVEFVGIKPTPPRGALWSCKCDCGAQVTVQAMNLRSGTTKSCGCLKRDHMRAVRKDSPGGPERGPAISAAKYKGNLIGYGRAHERVRDARGRAVEYDCAHCGNGADAWAFRHDAPPENVRYEGGRPYSVRVDDYLPLCNSCHTTYDNAERSVAA